MEKNLKAVFYDFKYYILPEETDIGAIEDGSVIRAKRLKEVECMAPDFVYESIEEETLEITDKNLLFPVRVNLYTKKEYNALLLKQINRVCPGCLRYTDDGDDEHLDGHHREISLGGTCYEREDDEKQAPYATRVMWFCYELCEHLDELAECIEHNKAAKLNKICKSCCGYVLAPLKFYGTKRDGKYFLYMECSFCSDLYLTMLSYTAFVTRYEENPVKKAGWTIIPFIPAGADGYTGKIKGTTPVGRLVQSEIPWKYYLRIRIGKFMTDKQRNKLIDDVYGYLAFKIGEDTIHRVIEGIDTENTGEVENTADEICEKLNAADEKLPDLFPPSLPYGWENEEKATPYKKSISGVSTCFNFANICAEPELAEDIGFSGEFVYAYLFVPASGENEDAVYDTVKYYLENEQSVPEPILLKDEFANSFVITGYANCTAEESRGWAFDMFVADEKMFYRYMKILAPVLSHFGAKIVVFGSTGMNVYECGSEIVPLGGGESN